MNLYLISHNENLCGNGIMYAVVCAKSKNEASRMHPGYEWPMCLDEDIFTSSLFDIWCSSPDKVSVQYLGKAGANIKPGPVLIYD